MSSIALVSDTLAKKAAKFLTETPRRIDLINLGENSSKICALSFGINFGPRYETKLLRGISHLIRSAALMSTRSRTKFGLQKDFQTKSIDFNVKQYKDMIIYNLVGSRSHAMDAVRIFIDMMTNPALFNFEAIDILNDHMPNYFTPLHMGDTQVVLDEAIHRASFGYSGLGNPSLYQPNKFLHSEHLEPFFQQTYTREFMIGAAFGFKDRVCQNISRELSCFDPSDVERRADPAKEIFIKGGFDFVNDEDAGFVKFAYTFCFEHTSAKKQDRLKHLLCLRMLKQYFGDGTTAFIYSDQEIGSTGILSDSITSALGLDKKLICNVRLYEYDSKTLFSFQFQCNSSDMDADRVVQHLKVFFKNIPKVQPLDLKVLTKKAVVSELKLREQYDTFTENSLRLAFLTGPENFDITEKFAMIKETDLNNLLEQFKVGSPSFAAVGDCPLVENYFLNSN